MRSVTMRSPVRAGAEPGRSPRAPGAARSGAPRTAETQDARRDAVTLAATVTLDGAKSKPPRGRVGQRATAFGLPRLRVSVPSLSRTRRFWARDVQGRSEAEAQRHDGVPSVRPSLHDDRP